MGFNGLAWCLLIGIGVFGDARGYATEVEKAAPKREWRVVVETVLAEWPQEDRNRVIDALPETEEAKRFSTEQLEAFLGSVVQCHGTPPKLTTEGADVVVATIDAAASVAVRTGTEESLYQSQFAEAKAAGEAWLEAHRAWFPDGVTVHSTQAFGAAIARAQQNPLNVGFQESLPEDVHAALMKSWKGEMQNLDALGETAFRQQFGIFLLREPNTPSWEWQRNEEAASGAAMGILKRYLELRHDTAVERLPEYSAVKAARDAVINARIEVERQIGPAIQPAGFGAHEELLEQEVLWLAMAALDGQPPFTPRAARDGKYSLHVPETTAEAPYQQSLVLQYRDTNQGTSGPGPFELHELQSILQSGGDCARFEILARTPILSSSAVFTEPIGWTLVRDSEGLVWLPGFLGGSLGVFRAKANDPDGPEMDCGFLEWGLNRKTSWSLYNLANVASGQIVSGVAPINGAEIEAAWSRRAPWFYMSRIERMEYVFRDSGGERVLDHARLIDAATGDVAATIVWRDPGKSEGGARYYREVVVEIAPIALKGLWRSDSRHSDDTAVAPDRSIVYRFSETEVGGKSVVVPTYFAVRGPEQTALVEMTFQAPIALTEVSKEVCDPLATLPVSQDTAPLAFYSLYKDYYYRYLTLSGDIQLREIGDWLDKFSRMRDLALAREDSSLALKCQVEVYSSALFARAQYPRWKAEVFRTIEMLEAIPDRDVAWEAFASMVQRVYSVDDPALASEVENRFTRMVTGRYSTAEAFGRGRDYGFVYALACFSAVEAKSLERNLLVPAAIGKADALAFLAKYVRNQQCPWEVAQCEVYLNAARETLNRAEDGFAPGDPEEWQKMANRARRTIQEAEQFLLVKP